MRSHRGMLAACLAVFFAANGPLHAVEDAVVKAERAAVRAEPSARAERLPGHLKAGEKVRVIDYVDDPQAKGNEPRRWARIELPAGFGVWIAAELVDPKTSAVKGARVNLRSGPGKNFSRVGQLDQGAKVTQIRIAEGWMQIEPPKGSQAFLAADLLGKGVGTPQAVQSTPPPPAKPTVAAAPPPARSQSSLASAPPVQASTPTPTPPPAHTRSPKPAAPSVQPAEVPRVEVPPVQNAEPIAAPAPVYAAPARPATVLTTTNWVQGKRQVIREGYLISSLNPRAPSGFFLLSKRRSEGMLNYVYTSDRSIRLGKFVNQTVRISGEEWVEPKSKGPPILMVESIERQ